MSVCTWHVIKWHATSTRVFYLFWYGVIVAVIRHGCLFLMSSYHTTTIHHNARQTLNPLCVCVCVFLIVHLIDCVSGYTFLRYSPPSRILSPTSSLSFLACFNETLYNLFAYRFKLNVKQKISIQNKKISSFYEHCICCRFVIKGPWKLLNIYIF